MRTRVCLRLICGLSVDSWRSHSISPIGVRSSTPIRVSGNIFEARNFTSAWTAQCKTHSNQGIVSTEAPHAAALIQGSESSKSSQRPGNGEAKNRQCVESRQRVGSASSLQQVPEGDAPNVLGRYHSSVKKRLGEFPGFSKRHLHPDTF